MATAHLDFINGNDSNSGADWANALKTFSSATNYAGTGGTVKVAKSPAPYSIGNATWTRGSYTVYLATAQTAVIDNCESSWSQASGTTQSQETWYVKQGSQSSRLVLNTDTVGKQFYKEIPETDFSAYQSVSFWLYTTGWYNNDQIAICLCSDTAGDTIVDKFYVPRCASYNFNSVTVKKYGGGNLGTSIKSVAIYVDSSFGGSYNPLTFDHIIACKDGGLNLNSLIQADTVGWMGDEWRQDNLWYPIQSIDGTTIKIDGGANCTAAQTYYMYGYAENSGTYTTYARECTDWYYDLSSGSAPFGSVLFSGTASAHCLISGGWNTTTDTQTGMTYINEHNGNGTLEFSNRRYIDVERIGLVKTNGFLLKNGTDHISFSYCAGICGGNESGFIYSNGSNNITVTDCMCNNHIANAYSATSGTDNRHVIDKLKFYSNSQGFTPAVNTVVTRSSFINNSIGVNYGYNATSSIFFSNCEIKRNQQWGVFPNYVGSMYFKDIGFEGNGNGTVSGASGINPNGLVFNDCSFGDWRVAYFTDVPNEKTGNFVFGSINHNNVAGNTMRFADGITTTEMANDRPGGSGRKIEFAINSTKRTEDYTIYTPLSQFPVNAGSPVTFTCWVQKSNATTVGAKLYVMGRSINGVYSDINIYKADDTDWQQLTLTFTPSEAGIVTVESKAFSKGGTGYVYFADINITQ